MHVFVTGATGWVGSAIVEELLQAGHRVTGLVRDGRKASMLISAGMKIVEATLDDQDILERAASTADAVIHTAFNHDFSNFMQGAAQDQRVIETLGTVLEGSDRPLLVTSGLLGLSHGATEADLPNPGPRKSEPAARTLAARGIKTATVRLAPSVHGIGDYGFVPKLMKLARETGVSAYLGDGDNYWAGVHRLDAARVYRLALEGGVTEQAYHAVADEAIQFKEIAIVIGRRLGVPAASRTKEHFGWFSHFVGANMAASSARTRETIGWVPRELDLLSDLDQPNYYEQAVLRL